jgi:hypothetical protein
MFDSITDIKEGSFVCCQSLSSIVIPDSVINIGANAFNKCDTLSSIIIPDNVANIEDGAFAFCKNLRDIRLPNDLLFFGEGVFKGCESLKAVYIDYPELVSTKIDFGVAIFPHSFKDGVKHCGVGLSSLADDEKSSSFFEKDEVIVDGNR